MDSRTVYANPLSGTVQKIHFHDDGAMTLQTTRDMTQVVDENKSLSNMTSSLDRWGDGKIVMRGVPHELTRKWKERGWFEKDQQWRILTDPEAQPYMVRKAVV